MALQEALTHIVHGTVLGRLRVGMRVLDLASDRVLFSRRGSVLMDPASNQKVLATTTALLRLGSTWRFRTELSGPSPDGDGTIAGDLILRGSGDPSLRETHLDAMAEDLARRGVSRIEGRVLGDPRRIGSDEAFVTGRSPVRVGWSTIEVRVRQGEKAGASALVSLWPGSDALRLVNQAVTGTGRNRIGVSLSRAGEHIQVLVTGKVGLGRHGMVIRRAPPSDTLYAAVLMRAALIHAGIEVRGLAGVYSGDERNHLVAAPADADLQLASATNLGDTPVALLRGSRAPGPAILTVHESAPLPLLIRRVNKNSDNEWAERVLEAAGAETYGGSASTAKGVRAMRDALADSRGASIGLPAGQRLGLGPPESGCPGHHGGPAAQVVFRPAGGARSVAVALSGWRGRHHSQSFSRLLRGGAGAGQDRHTQRRVVFVRLRRRQVRRGGFLNHGRGPPSPRGHQRAQRPGERGERDDALCARHPWPCAHRAGHADRGSGNWRRSRRTGKRNRLPESAPAQKSEPSIEQMLKDFGARGSEP